MPDEESMIQDLRELEEELRQQGEYRKANIIDLFIRHSTHCKVNRSDITKKIEELDKRIDYLNTELNKCYIEREKLGTETDIDNNETAIYYMEREEEYRNKQKEILQELLNQELLNQKNEEKEFKIITGGRHQGKEMENAINLYQSVQSLPDNEVYSIVKSRGFINIFKIQDNNNKINNTTY